MAVMSQGAYGALSGKLGNTIAGSWKGINYLRIKPASVNDANTLLQQNQRGKFSLVLKLLQPFRDGIKIGFKDYAVKMSAFNSATSYNLKNAVEGVLPSITIDYAAVLLSRGPLKPALNPTVSSTVPGEVEFAWTANSSELNSNSSDQAMVFIFNPETNEGVTVPFGTMREMEGQSVTVPDSFSGTTVHTWIAFVSDDRKLVSNSLYAGEVNVA